MWELGVYIAVIVVAFSICISIAASAVYLILWRKKKTKHHASVCSKSVDLELQQLSLSVRTVSEKKVSFESSSQMDALDGHLLPITPRQMVVVENYTLEELSKATADFSSANLIEGSVYHGRLKGKNLAIKCTDPQTISKIKFELFQNATHFHPNIIRLLGTCMVDGQGMTGPDVYLVFEYAKNGSLKDWIHGGLAMKSQFIASCYCFLTWNQRLRICLDVATALQYMHQILSPSNVHRNIKSRNIFLDEEFKAKIGNFGMEECIKDEDYPEEEPCSGYLYSTFPTSWDKGYMAPEYANSGVINPSIDIYAYGVVLLEILSGKPPISSVKLEKKEGTSVWLTEKIKFILESDNPAGKLREWMDNVLGENYSFDAAVTLGNLARACVEDDPSLRPNAGEIVQKISKLVEELPDGEEQQFTICESSCKPLVVKTAAL